MNKYCRKNSLEYANYSLIILKHCDIKITKELKAQIRGFETKEEVDRLRTRLQIERLEQEPYEDPKEENNKNKKKKKKKTS